MSSMKNPWRVALGFEVGEPIQLPNGFLYVPMQGYVDADNAPLFANQLKGYLEKGHKSVDLGFDRIKFITSTGIGTVISAVAEYRDVGGELIISGVPEEIYELFKTLDLLDYLRVIRKSSSLSE